MQEDNGHRTHRHVRLPGGRQIEVVYLDRGPERHEQGPSRTSQPAQAASDTSIAKSQPTRADSDTPVAPSSWRGDSSTKAPQEALHVCPHCEGERVSPLDWVEESPGRWHILMRCPDCDLMREGVFGQALVERLDEELDRATAAMLSDLKQLTHANMVEEIELFSRALQLDLIGPGDF